MQVTLLRTQIAQEEDVVLARQRAREVSRMVGFDHQDQTRIATAISELARNAYQYASGGRVEFAIQAGSSASFLVVQVLDRGPGIKNLDEVLSGSYKSSTGMGVGLLGAKRLMDAFSVVPREGGGTQVTLRKLLPPSFTGTAKRLQELAENLGRLERVKTYDEVALQNRELIAAMEELELKQRELNQINQELEDTNRGVVALYAELDQRAEDLRRANSVKTRFLSNITHEFRSPLNSVKNLTSLLLDRVDGPLTEEQEKQVTLIRKSVLSLSTMVDDLLDLAKVEAGKVPVRVVDFDLKDVFSSLRGLFRASMESGVELVIEDPVEPMPLRTDEGKVTQILRNFMSNALKYTERGSVELRVERMGPELLRISVRDSGIGIPEESREAIFEEFVQVESRLQTKVKGTGLGLPLSRRLAELLGGKIELESRIGAGSTFVLSLPTVYDGPDEGDYVDSHESVPIPVPSRIVPGARGRILLVDDQEQERYLIRSVLASQYDCEIHETSSALQGISRARELLPDLMVVDLSMPDLSGFEVIKRIRAGAETARIPLAVFSGKELSSGERDFLRDQNVSYFSKTETDEETLIQGLAELASRIGLRAKDAQG